MPKKKTLWAFGFSPLYYRHHKKQYFFCQFQSKIIFSLSIGILVALTFNEIINNI